MIIGIGTDIIEIGRVEKAALDIKFIEKYFTEDESAVLNGKTQSIAANFACKESAAKALGTGFTGFSPRDVEVLRDAEGRPVVNLYNGALARFRSVGGTRIYASVSHCKEYATALCVIEGD